MTIFITLLICLPIFTFAWMAIHELSHYLMCRSFVDITDVQFKLYPHFHKRDGKKTFRFAGVRWKYIDKIPTGKQSGLIYLAPRIPDVIAAILLPLGILFMPPVIPLTIWLCFFGCGLVDLGYGSAGISEFSDTKRASMALDISPNLLRALGYTTLCVSGGLTLALLLA